MEPAWAAGFPQYDGTGNLHSVYDASTSAGARYVLRRIKHLRRIDQFGWTEHHRRIEQFGCTEHLRRIEQYSRIPNVRLRRPRQAGGSPFIIEDEYRIIQSDMSTELSNPGDAVRVGDVESYLLNDDGTFPNNGTLPALVYREAFLLLNDEPAGLIESVFGRNSWDGTWRNGIYSYHHYHSTAHEVLGVASGTARVQLGGGEGPVVEVSAGDAIVIPAGVAHKNLGSSSDFLVVGAYPEGQDWDMNYGRAGERPRADRNIQQTPLPTADPIFGGEGPLLESWHPKSD